MMGAKNLTGKKFGRLTAISPAASEGGRTVWLCQCDCGKKVKVRTTNLTSQNTKSCGCADPKKQDLVGARFGKLTVIKRHPKKSANNSRMWVCLCDCGNKKTTRTDYLNYGLVRSCGCFQRDSKTLEHNSRTKKLREKYGDSIPQSDPLYRTANNLINKALRDDIKVGFESRMEMALYLRDIMPKKCPVFGFTLKRGEKVATESSPSVDRIIPKKGYVRGNLQILSSLANSMKRDATPKQLKQFAEWVLQ